MNDLSPRAGKEASWTQATVHRDDPMAMTEQQAHYPSSTPARLGVYIVTNKQANTRATLGHVTANQLLYNLYSLSATWPFFQPVPAVRASQKRWVSRPCPQGVATNATMPSNCKKRCHGTLRWTYMGLSINGDTVEWMVYTGKSH